MSGVDRVLRPVDLAQQRRAWLALPVAAARKFGEDSAGNLAALLAYYAFAAIFPLLLTFSTIVGYILDSRSGLRRELLDSAVVDFPVIRDQLRTTGLQGHWYVIVISLAISLWGARGVAGAAQAALNAVWNVPYAQRPGFPAVVRAHRLWPRSLVQPPLTGGDKRAYRAYAEATRRRPASEQRVEVDFSDPVVPEEPTIGS